MTKDMIRKLIKKSIDESYDKNTSLVHAEKQYENERLAKIAAIDKFKSNLPAYKEEMSTAAKRAAIAIAGSPDVLKLLNVVISTSYDDDDNSVLFSTKNKINRLDDVIRTFDLDVYSGSNAAWTKNTLIAQFQKISSRILSDLLSGHTSIDRVEHVKRILMNIPLLVSQLEKFVAKNETELVKAAEAPHDAPLGRIAFAGARKGKPFEPDTAREKKLHIVIMRHFSENKAFGAKDAADIKALLKKGWYSDVFKPPGVSIVYRGMGVSKKWLQAAIKKKDIKPVGSLEKGFTFTPRTGGSSSWSTAKIVAEEFGTDNDYQVIMHARIDDNVENFVTGPGGLYNVAGCSEYEFDNEVVGLGKIKVFKVAWICYL